MSSPTFFFIFVPFLALLLLSINLIFAPRNPYQEKKSVFECGFHSFLGQNRTQFSISFFIFALLFLLFDLEILLVYPYIVSAYTNSVYGLFIMLMFFIALTIGLGFELGKKALNIDSRQVFRLDANNMNKKAKYEKVYQIVFLGRKKKLKNILSHPHATPLIQSKISYLKISFFFFILWLFKDPFRFSLIIFIVRNFFLHITNIDFGELYMVYSPEANDNSHVVVFHTLSSNDEGGGTVSPAPSPNDEGGGNVSPADSPDNSSEASDSSRNNSDDGMGGNDSPLGDNSEDAPSHRVRYWHVVVDHTNHPATNGSCLDNPNHNSNNFPADHRVNPTAQNLGYDGTMPPIRGQATDLYHNQNPPYGGHNDCCRCGQDTHNTESYECDVCNCSYCPGCVSEQEKSDYDDRHNN